MPIRQIRTTPIEATLDDGAHLNTPVLTTQCDTGRPQRGEKLQSIEDYGDYVLSFAEFDDQGWSYDSEAQMRAIQRRLQAEIAGPAYKDLDFAVMVFVHGWHHNAHDNDCNVQEARQMVWLANRSFKEAHETRGFRGRRVFGIYVGWRGESVDADGLRYLTVIDRRDAAEKVAKGSIRQLFANLQQLQMAAQAAAARDRSTEVDSLGGSDASRRMYTTIIGHSFGGLVVFNSLSQQLTDDLTAKLQGMSGSACSSYASMGIKPPLSQIWPDEVVLINPAFEATRFEALNRLSERSATCGYSDSRPLVTVVTARNDRWTGKVFSFARRFLTIFEGYDESTPQTHAQEHDANVHAIGFVDRYQTHRLCLRGSDKDIHATASRNLPSAGESLANTLRPVWVVTAPPVVVDGHNGFLYARPTKATATPYLLNWLLSRHLDPSLSLASPGECDQ